MSGFITHTFVFIWSHLLKYHFQIGGIFTFSN
jgi:hypothetical protein